MDLEAINHLLSNNNTTSNSIIDSMPFRYFDPFITKDLKLVKVKPGLLICSMKVSSRLITNDVGYLHEGAIASIVDLVGSAAVFTAGGDQMSTGVSVEINVSYLDVVGEDEEVEIEARVLRDGKSVVVVSVEIRKVVNGKIIAQGRHTKYIAVAPSKL